MRIPNGKFVRQAGAIYVYQAINVAAAFVASVVIARGLGPQGKGTVDVFILVTTLVAEVGLLGITSGFLYHLANKRRPLHEIHGDAIAVAIVVGLIGVALALLAPDLLASLLGNVPVFYVSLALAMTGFYAYTASWATLMLGVDRAPFMHRVQAVVAVVTVVVVACLWLLGYLTVETAVATAAIVGLGGGLMRYHLARKMHASSRPKPTRRSLEASLRYGLRTYPGVLANWLHFRVDQIVIANVVGLAGVGIYTVSVRWAEMLWIVGYGLLNAGVYRIASSSESDSYSFARRLFWATLMLTGAAGLVLGILAIPLIGTLYGEEYQAAVLPLLLLIPGVVAWDASRVLSNHLSYNRGRPEIPTVVAVLGATLNLGATLYAVPIWGIAGAAAASTITYALVLAATAVAFWLGGRGSGNASTNASEPPTMIGELDALATLPEDALG